MPDLHRVSTGSYVIKAKAAIAPDPYFCPGRQRCQRNELAVPAHVGRHFIVMARRQENGGERGGRHHRIQRYSAVLPNLPSARARTDRSMPQSRYQRGTRQASAGTGDSLRKVRKRGPDDRALLLTVYQISMRSEISSTSSDSAPRYRTALSIFVYQSRVERPLDSRFSHVTK